MAYQRACQETGEKAVVLLNFSDKDKTVAAAEFQECTVLCSNQATQGVKDDHVQLVPFGAIVLYSK